MIITENTCLQQVAEIIGWENVSYMLDPMEGVPGFETVLGNPFSQQPLSVLRQVAPAWGLQPIIYGLEHLVERCKAGQVFYSCSHQPHTGLAVFPLKKRSKCVIICPGGGYFNVCSLAEGYPIAARLNELGYAAVVVNYRTNGNAAAPNPMEDLASAVRFVFDHADEWNLDMEGYAVMGFSAGGHLAASFGTSSLGYAHYGLPKPGCMMLAYPVVTMGEFAHAGSRELLLGKDADKTLVDSYSIEKQVDAAYPKTFLWQCDRDDVVPVENSRMLAASLEHWDIPHQYELFPGTAHGWGLATDTAADGWVDRAVTFWEE